MPDLKLYEEYYHHALVLLKGLKTLEAIQRSPAGVQYIALAKGLIQPGDLRVGGVLQPQAASALINMVFADAFLSRVSTEYMVRLKKDVLPLDIAPRQLKRVAQGSEPQPGDKAKVDEHGAVLTALDAQLFADISLDTLRDNQDNPQVLALINTMIANRISADMVDLGFNGVEDTYAGGDFINLNKGWVQIATDSAATHKETFDIVTEADWIDALAKIRKAQDDDYKPTSVIIMNSSDADEYRLAIGKHVTGAAVLADREEFGFLAQPVVPSQYMPSGTVMYTPIKNLVVGMHTRIERSAEYHARRRALEITVDTAFDFEIQVKRALVIATRNPPAPPGD